MKLLRAEFQNFRLLQDLKLEFSCDSDRNLTVIRAANESGKTTILHALQWALYGEAALPRKGVNFRLHPIDWKEGDVERIPISATVDFELTKNPPSRGKVREIRKNYRLVRTTHEDVDNHARRSTSTVKLFELKDTGASPINEPEAVINEELPLDLREVFFTDGDRALSFIEADVSESAKRDRVQGAIRSLLNLGVIENAIKHVGISKREVNKKAKQLGANSELDNITSKIEKIDNKQDELVEDYKDAKQQFEAFDNKVKLIEKEVLDILQKGDREKLSKELSETNQELKRLSTQLDLANKKHSELFRSSSIASDLLSPVLEMAFEKLKELHDQGKIPSTTIPILKDRLEANLCICGESLEIGDKNGEERRDYINNLISESERADEIQELITGLYYVARDLQTSSNLSSQEWVKKYREVMRSRDDLKELRDEAGRKYRNLEKQLDSIPDTDIIGLRKTLREYQDQRDRFLTKQVQFEAQLTNLKEDRTQQEIKRDKLLREMKKGSQIVAELEVTHDILKVLENAFEKITNLELQNVSDLMNKIFIQMIGADPKQGAIIRRAEISPEFDIIVYGPNHRKLNPDLDLNGASRRALTLAFILALTNVSKVEAPNVIDTPLGMTSDFVKRSILHTAVQESSQLILLLTPAEIMGCEDIIDSAAGKIFTLTNPAHYPKMLVHDPNIEERKILRCECNHRSDCELCQRRTGVI
ncbi:MAG: AAA family ATPase [Rhodobacteraceae bacterium]|nr:AAA family ATPase [Paracoccaceae bacterium]